MNLARVQHQFSAVLFPDPPEWEDYGIFCHRDAATAAAWSLELHPPFKTQFAVRVVKRGDRFVIQRRTR